MPRDPTSTSQRRKLLRAASAATRISYGRTGHPARLGWAEVADLDQPADGVGESFAQWAWFDAELAAGLRVIAAGVAVHHPDPLTLPRQPHPQPPLQDVCRAAERGQERAREDHEPYPPPAELAKCADEVGQRDIVAGNHVAARPAAGLHNRSKHGGNVSDVGDVHS